MHARQRSPGNGYRSGFIGMGEGSIRRGHGFYASEYRHVNRDGGFGRGHGNPKSFPLPPQLPSRKGDIFMEAGRLAAEYLVSQGLLPPNVLSIKWRNASFKRYTGELREFRPQDGETLQIPLDGRTSALARLGNTIPDTFSGRRKFGLDDSNQKMRRRGASLQGNGLDWDRDLKRSGSWSGKLGTSPDIKDNDDAVIRHHDEEQQQQVGGSFDNGSLKSNSNEFVLKIEHGIVLDTEKEMDLDSSEMNLKASSSGAAKDTDVEISKASDDLENMSTGGKEVKDSTCNDDTERSNTSKNFSVSLSAQESQTSSRFCTDLLTLCKSVKVPTRTRSSLTCRGLKVDALRNNGDENTNDLGCLQGPKIVAEAESVEGSSSGDLLTDKTYNINHLESEIANVQSVHSAEKVKDLGAASNAEQGTSVRSQSCQKNAYMPDNNQACCMRLPEYGSCSPTPMVEERGEKRAVEVGDVREETKKLRECLPSIVPRTEDYFLHNNLSDQKVRLGQDEISLIDKVDVTSDQESLMSNPQFTRGADRPLLHCSVEKQPLPSSFRTCDLNLIEASEVHENHDDHPILIYPSVSETKKEAAPVDIDLSISHTSVSGKFSTHVTARKEIEVIDLENDSAQEGKSTDNMDRKTDAIFPGLEGFSNHAQNTGDIHDVQDGYGLMISELLANDFPNCSSVPGDINSVNNEMGTLGEDDSIYMSLEEIPLSFLPTWEQPSSQEYGKPF